MGWPKGMPRSEETRVRIGAAQLGRKRPAETGARISAALLGKTRGPMSAERRAKVTRHGHLVGGSTTPTHNTWFSMIQRCTYPHAARWKDYGGRGITVCDRWNVPHVVGEPNVGFDNFLADMGVRPVGTTIDRIDNSLGYFPGNCRWATPKEQRANQRPCKKAA